MGFVKAASQRNVSHSLGRMGRSGGVCYMINSTKVKDLRVGDKKKGRYKRSVSLCLAVLFSMWNRTETVDQT